MEEVVVLEDVAEDLVIRPELYQEVLETEETRIVVVEVVQQVIVEIPDRVVEIGDNLLVVLLQENQFRKEMPESNIILIIL